MQWKAGWQFARVGLHTLLREKPNEDAYGVGRHPNRADRDGTQRLGKPHDIAEALGNTRLVEMMIRACSKSDCPLMRHWVKIQFHN